MTCASGYSPEEILAAIFRGDSEESARETLAQLEALGDGPQGDRLRCLFMRLVQWMQGRSYEHGGSLRRSSGRPLTSAEIAHEILWDATRIEPDLAKLRDVGLMEEIKVHGLLGQGVN